MCERGAEQVGGEEGGYGSVMVMAVMRHALRGRGVTESGSAVAWFLFVWWCGGIDDAPLVRRSASKLCS